jgi:hypothetical protein
VNALKISERDQMSKNIEVTISCKECVRRSTPDCSDCLVSFVLGSTPDELVMSGDEAKIIELFTNEGMIPGLKYRQRVELRP